MKIQHKRSASLESGKAKEPTPAQTEFGEVCVNFNSADPALFIRDNADNIVRVGGDLSLYQKIDEVGSVVLVCSPSEIDTQSPPADRVEGTLWWDTEEGVLYVWYEDANSSQWVIAIPQSDIEGTDFLSSVNDDTAAGEITFEKVTTHEAGVSVTGGDGTGFDKGIYSDATQTLALKSGANTFTINENSPATFDFTSATNVDGSSQTQGAIFKFHTNADFTKPVYGVVSNLGTQGFTSTSTVCTYYASIGTPANVSSDGPVIGYRSDVKADANQGTGGSYNFYAASSAPNYFNGLTEHASGINVSGTVLCQIENPDATSQYSAIAATGINTKSLYSPELDLFRADVSIGGTGGIINSQLYADPTFAGSTNSKHLNVAATNYYNSGGLTVNPSSQRPTAITAISAFQNGFDSTKPGNDLIKYGFLSKTNSDYAQKDLDPNNQDDAKLIGTATGFGAWNGGKVKNYRGFEFLTGGSNGINNIGFYSKLDVVANGDNYSNYHAGTAPNYFAKELLVGADMITNADTNAEKWTSGNGSLVYPGQFKTAADNSNASISPVHLNRIGSATGSLIRFYENGALIDAIKLDGSGGITYGPSDYRLKENIVDLPSATDAIKSLRPVNFNFKSHPGKTRPGFIAHEVSETLSVAVTGTKDETEAIGTLADYDGTVLETEVTEPDDLTYTEEVETDGVSTMVTRTRSWTPTGNRPVYQGVDQIKLIPLLTKALQEALARIEELESNTLQPLYSTLADLPDASEHHGKTAHVHSEGALYFAHAGNWVKLQNA